MVYHKVSRRQFAGEIGKGVVSAAALPFASDSGVAYIADVLGATDPLQGKRLYRDVVTYSRLGEHRSGTEVDQFTALWMELHLRTLGFQTERQEFLIPGSFVQETTLVLGNLHHRHSVEAFPLWPVRFSNAPIVRPLVAYSHHQLTALRGNIALISFPFVETGLITQEMANLVKAAADAGAVAVVGITEGPTGLLTEMNPSKGQAPWPIPVVLVGPRDRAVLQGVVKSAVSITLNVTGQTDNAASAVNIIGRLQRKVGAPWVVISTTISGWFACGGERGPGVAVWRGLSRLIASRWLVPAPAKGPVNYLFVATSGHELNSLGIDAFLQSAAPAPADVLMWFHLGAWLASYAWTTPQDGSPPQRLTTENQRLLFANGLGAGLLSPLVQLPGIIRSFVPVGEISSIVNAGYTRALTITGRNIPHHTRLDVAENTGPDMLEPVGHGIDTFLTNAVMTLPRPS